MGAGVGAAPTTAVLVVGVSTGVGAPLGAALGRLAFTGFMLTITKKILQGIPPILMWGVRKLRAAAARLLFLPVPMTQRDLPLKNPSVNTHQAIPLSCAHTSFPCFESHTIELSN